YSFDLTAIANDWSVGTPSDGISIVPTVLDTTSQRPFSIALAGKNAVVTKASWSAPAPAVAPAPPVVPVVPAQTVPAVAPPPDLSSGTTGGLVPVPSEAAAAPPVI